MGRGIGHVERAGSRVETGLIRHRMPSFDHVDNAQRASVAMPGHRNAAHAICRKAAIKVMRFGRLGH